MSFLKNLFDTNERELRRLWPLVQAVNEKGAEAQKLSDDQFPGKTAEFRLRAERGEDPDKMLPEVYAVAREAAARTLEQRPFDVQVLGAAVLHQGRIAEMQTGEGKTLTATLPSYLNAIAGRSVHVVTVNDYLARFHSEWMGQMHRFLGLSVGLVVPGMDSASKRRSYSHPIIYGTNTEFGFDYLRDNMAYRVEDLVQGVLDFAIIDEVDSILIDEARTPLIISGPSEGTTDRYYRFRDLARNLRREIHYTFDEKARLVALTEEGHQKTAQWLKIDLDAPENIHLQGYIRQALRAKEIMVRDVDYVVKDGEILIVDEFTGRILPGRRYSDGLHQAIEAKEGISVKEESDTYATVTVQNFFRMYKKLSGMTGTALTEEPEFRDIYGLDVVVIPTNRPLMRTSLPDSIWRTETAKFRAVVEDIKECHQSGRPVLVGTRSIERSEMLSQMLFRAGVPHEVLNAKHHDKEAEIVAQAGRRGAVTIATNMAGRGTDILLGGNPEFMARRDLVRQGYDWEVAMLASEKILPRDLASLLEEDQERAEQVKTAKAEYGVSFAERKKTSDKEHGEVVELGGLYVLGTERHEARRIDNQLRGRSGRQGDPGVSRFYLSMDDELLRLFGGEKLPGMMDRIGFSEDEPIEHNLVTRAVETAQKRIEAQHFGIRKNVLEYDNVLNKQREVIYGDRRRVLLSTDIPQIVDDMARAVVASAMDLFWPPKSPRSEVDFRAFAVHMKTFLPGIESGVLAQSSDRESLEELLLGGIRDAIAKKTAPFGDNEDRVMRLLILQVTDHEWREQLRSMEDLREGVGLQAYGQKDPLVEYTRLGYEMFLGRTESIASTTVSYLTRIEQKRAQVQAGSAPAQQGTAPRPRTPAKAPKTPVGQVKKVGRNDPCPCGSGKKYKNCHGKIV